MRLTRHWTPAAFYWTAVAIGAVYVFVTPVFTVPDEAEHFFRGLAVARGKLTPAPRPAPLAVDVDEGVRVFAWHGQVTVHRTGRYGKADLGVARHIRRQGVSGPLFVTPIYTPLPYLPQALIAAASDRARARPLLTFYAGRLANLAVWMGVIALAIRVAPLCAPLFAAVALLPMTLFLFASWSADAAAISLAMLFTAFAVRAVTASGVLSRSELVALTASAFLLTLCKPVYGLLPALVLAIPRRRFPASSRHAATVVLVGLATLAGAAMAVLYFNRAYFNMRVGLPVDPAAQIACIAHAPMRFVHAVIGDLIGNARFYARQAVGRFGQNEFSIPDAVIAIEWLVLLLAALTTRTAVGRPFRLAGAIIAAASAIGIVASQYLIWSIACGDSVEGVQGRYFLPVIPVAAIAVGGLWNRPIPPAAMLAVAGVCNAAAFGTLLVTYW
ncbi:MAG TPA: DUF2142 domain-containing protein [Thermoanaerobaculia bacterium]|nr:DUF2142 domain-containing protein [Thermoanaerobaculia bacterium]